MSTETPAGSTDRGTAFWVSAAAGWALIAWGFAGVARHQVDTRPADLARFVAGGLLVHDLVLVPTTLLAALVVVWVVPRRWRRWVQAALVVAAPLALFAYPLVRGFGRIPTNPTALPHDYATNLAWVVAVVVTAVAVVSAVMACRVRARLRAPPRGARGRSTRRWPPGPG